MIFTQTLANRFIKSGYRIIWPVLEHFINDLNRAYPNVSFVSLNGYNKYMNIKEQKEVDGMLIVPLRWSMEIYGCEYNKVMAAKYLMYGYDYREWRELAKWQRDVEKEKELFEVYHFPINYKLINNNFQSDFGGKSKIPTGADTIDMTVIDGYSLFDWALVLERATEIHTVSTSIIYLLELLDIPGERVHLYPRPSDPQFKQVDYLFSKPYILHL